MTHGEGWPGPDAICLPLLDQVWRKILDNNLNFEPSSDKVSLASVIKAPCDIGGVARSTFVK
jgi:hypothetical protein